MKFIDEVKIFVQGGRGGDGCVAFRREKYVPRGGPSGGDGGKGGDVILKVDPRLRTLLELKLRPHIQGKKGEHGKGKNKHGKNGQPVVVYVPPGTMVYDANKRHLLADLCKKDDFFIGARGGRGGRGNARFVSSTNRAPQRAEKGSQGEKKTLILELKLIADVGVIGYPNVGKSTLVSQLSKAKPKIADYPFTTLVPTLGVVSLERYQTFVIADIPGLVPGASKDVGLGIQFLRHIERTKVLVHIITLREEGTNPWADFYTINQELKEYSHHLYNRPQIIVLNKIDLPYIRSKVPEIIDLFKRQGYKIHPISCITKQGLKELSYLILEVLKKTESKGSILPQRGQISNSHKMKE